MGGPVLGHKEQREELNPQAELSLYREPETELAVG